MTFAWQRMASIAALAGTTLFMSACGGGDAVVASTLSFPLKSAYTADFNEAKAWPYTLSGTQSGLAVSGSGTLTRGGPALGSFEGAPVLRKVSTLTGTVVVGGVSTPFADTLTDYADASFNPVGATASGEYHVVTGTVTIPISAKVGDSGTLYSVNRYSSSTKTELLGASTYTYVLEAATAETALLKVIETEKATSGAVTATTTAIHEITAAGTLTRRSETSVSGVDTLTVTYGS